MKLSTFLAFVAVVTFVFGLLLLLFPAQLLSLYGVILDLPGQFRYRYVGSAYLGLALTAWLARSASREILKPILLGDFVISITGFIIAVGDKLALEVNPLGWGNIIIYLLLTLGFSYFTFLKRQED
jgi:hypothetical protein